MFIKFLKPITSSQRNKIIICKNILSKNKLVKQLNYGILNNSGRDRKFGRITTRHKGGGCKSNYRNLLFLNTKFIGIVISIEYDPNRTSFISLVFNLINKKFFYLLNVDKIFPGALLSSNFNYLLLGSRLQLFSVPVGTLINSINSKKSLKINLLRSAGVYGQLLQSEGLICKIKLPSTKIIGISSFSFCSIGIVSNLKNNMCRIGKAGTNRLRNIRPSVRGIAMNPVDHPHGGRTNGGTHPLTPWGYCTKGKKTKKL